MSVNQYKKPPIIKYLLIFLGLVSILELGACATRKDTEFVEVESHQVEKSLGIDNKKFNKFQVKEEVTSSETKVNRERAEEVSSKDIKPTKEVVPKVKKEKPNKQEAEKKPVEIQGSVQESDESEEGEVKEDESSNPYPEAYRKYDEVSKKIWPNSTPIIRVGEQFVFQVSYLGLTAGHIQMETKKPVKVGGKNAYHFSAKLRSARYYSYIYTLDDSLDSYVTVDEFLPLKYVLAQRESSQTVDDLQLFDHDELKTYHWYKRIKHGKLKEVELTKYIPAYFQDSFSALHFVRSLPLKEGDHYEFPIVTRGKIWILGLKVERAETIEVMDKDIKAIRINAETRFPGVLEKRGDILFWFSADSKKRLLKFEAQVKIGSVGGELVEYKDGKPL